MAVDAGSAGGGAQLGLFSDGANDGGSSAVAIMAKRKKVKKSAKAVRAGGGSKSSPGGKSGSKESAKVSGGAKATKQSAAAKSAAKSPSEAADPPAKSKRAKNRKVATAESMAKAQREISVSEFFAKNRHLLGFDNKRKALLTTVKEAVDNSLDACEEADILPEIVVKVHQLDEERFRITIQDNGPGIVKAQIPNIFGKLLYGSKFHRLKMSRGQQGIGISAAGMYGLITTGKPVSIVSRTSKRAAAHHYKLAIDTKKNRPDIVADETVEVDWAHGTKVEIELIGSFARGKQSIDEYLEQTAIANPHATIFYHPPTGGIREMPRGTDEMPEETREIKPHPYGVELGTLMKMLKESDQRQVGGFLSKEFSRVSPTVASKVAQQAGLTGSTWLKSMDHESIERLYTVLQAVKLKAPPTDCLSPIGIKPILSGLLKEVKAEFYTATTRRPTVYRGNPFLIEAGIAFGGTLGADSSARVIRFANRVPLLYQQSACAAFKSVMDVDWRNYGLSQPGGSLPVGPLVVMVHMASVWVPFTSESKEAIADYDEIRKEMALALRECGRKLGSFVRKRKKQRMEVERRSIFTRYIPDVAEALSNLTKADEAKLIEHLEAIAQTRTAEADMTLDEDGNPVPKEDPLDESHDETIILATDNSQQFSEKLLM
jgi:DNA topoisomerase-6 subunit B